jgi:hypothetical protein
MAELAAQCADGHSMNECDEPRPDCLHDISEGSSVGPCTEAGRTNHAHALQLSLWDTVEGADHGDAERRERAVNGMSRHLIAARSAGCLRSDDFHETPELAVEALLQVEQFTGPIWEPACGLGAISRVLEKHGHRVISTDLVDRGFGTSRIDFLMEGHGLAPNIATNPPYKNSLEFAEHATRLATARVALLCRLSWLAGQKRRRFFESCPIARIWVFSKRLPLMHRSDWTGHRSTSTIDFAWFVWVHGHSGPWTGGFLP